MKNLIAMFPEEESVVLDGLYHRCQLRARAFGAIINGSIIRTRANKAPIVTQEAAKEMWPSNLSSDSQSTLHSSLVRLDSGSKFHKRVRLGSPLLDCPSDDRGVWGHDIVLPNKVKASYCVSRARVSAHESRCVKSSGWEQ